MVLAYLKLFGAALLPSVVSLILYKLEKNGCLSKVRYWPKQVIYGIVFGALAVLGTEAGIQLESAQVNCRDGAVLCAGLLFGAPAGIIAGLIGGIERWLSVYWGISSFTRVACTLSTIIAGFFAAALRKYMFEDKKPGVFISFASGIVIEIFHMTMVFITNMDEPQKAMSIVAICTTPMVLACGLSVMLASLLLTLAGHHKHLNKQENIRISQTIQRWLLITVAIAFALTSFFVVRLQDTTAAIQSQHALEHANEEVINDILDSADGDIAQQVIGATRNKKVGDSGYVLIFDQDMNPVSLPKDITEDNLPDLSALAGIEEDVRTELTLFDGVGYYCLMNRMENYKVIAIQTVDEAMQMRTIAIYVNTFLEILVFALMFCMIYLLVRRVVVDQIESINKSLDKISGGNLNEIVNVRSNVEFASLSDDINATVSTLKNYIAEASARIDRELEAAKSIQMSALPTVRSNFTGKGDLDIHAFMATAKEVGGDFYDFYISGKDKFNFLIADVSGKGVPAAMFMMRAKTELKNLLESGTELDSAFYDGNIHLCQGNDAEMFVTAWQGSLNLKNGTLHYVNAGHNHPLVKHGDEPFKMMTGKVNFVLGGMEGVRYVNQEIELEKGDKIFLYTDGVTEATNANQELYGNDRLLAIANARDYATMEEMCKAVKQDVDAFVGEAPQFDDMTMLGVHYIGQQEEWHIEFEEASLEDIPIITEKVEEELEARGIPLPMITQFSIAIDEIYSNIVKFAYPGKKGFASVSIREYNDETPRGICLIFMDRGIPYNPLTNAEPNTSLSAEERDIGGLGILIVKKTMDDVRYHYKNDMNVFKIRKFLK